MPRLPRRLAAATTCALTLGAAAPALAHAASAAQPTTALASKIEYVTRFAVGYGYPELHGQPIADQFTGRAAQSAGGAIVAVNRTAADSAQLQAKLEWLVGVNLQIDGDTALVEGTRALTHHHAANAHLRFTQALTDYRRSNYLINQADTTLGVRHPRLSAKPAQTYSDRPAPSGAAVTPTIPITARLSLTATIEMATPVIAETIPEHLYLHDDYSLLGPDQTACQYYALLVGRMRSSPAQREWVAGVSAQRQGNRMLFLGLYTREGSKAADVREADAGLTMLRHADALIGAADAALGIRQSGPSARLPRTFDLGY